MYDVPTSRVAVAANVVSSLICALLDSDDRLATSRKSPKDHGNPNAPSDNQTVRRKPGHVHQTPQSTSILRLGASSSGLFESF